MQEENHLTLVVHTHVYIIFEDITFNVEIFLEMEKGSFLKDEGEKNELTPFPEYKSMFSFKKI